jgi:MerR family transcriptional regulator, copper efflux regulator
MTDPGLMTIGALSHRTGTPVKALRDYADRGLIYTAGRSSANYRLFDGSALWCVAVIRGLRSLGLTLTEIGDLAAVYLGQPAEPIGPHLAERLDVVRERLDERIRELAELRRRIDDFEACHRQELASDAFRASDPATAALDSPPGGRP